MSALASAKFIAVVDPATVNQLEKRITELEDWKKQVETQYRELCCENHRLRMELSGVSSLSRSKRVFAYGATYDDPLLFFDEEDGSVWGGPSSPDDNLHFANFKGFMEDGITPIWVLETSAARESWRPICGYKEIVPRAKEAEVTSKGDL